MLDKHSLDSIIKNVSTNNSQGCEERKACRPMESGGAGESFKKQSWEEEKLENPVIKERNEARKRASDLQRRAAEIQGARYETTLYRLMERSGNNRDLINALNNFTREFDNSSDYGRSDQPLASPHVEKLTKFFEEIAKELDSPDFFYR
jgi:hypothetical protein